MKKIYILVSTLFMIGASAQVGINTQTPAGTLDVNGNLFIRTTPASPTAASYNVLAVNPTTKEVQVVNTNLQSAVNNTIAKVEGTLDRSLLTVNVATGYDTLDFSAGTIRLNPGSYFSAATDSYLVPSSGIYEIYYELRLNDGLQASILPLTGGLPSIGIFKKTGTITNLLDSRNFSGVNLTLILGVTISNSSINNIYQLQKDDQISFGYKRGGVTLGVADNIFVTLNLRKISD